MFCRRILAEELGVKTPDFRIGMIRVLHRFPFDKSRSVILQVVPEEHIYLVSITVGVIILVTCSVPQFIAVPDCSVIPVTEIRTMAENRLTVAIIVKHIAGLFITRN